MRLDSGRATLVLMRHGETAWNREGRVMGDLDIALSDEGRAQCRAAAALVAGLGVDRIVTSPLRRARESADLLAAALAVPVSDDPRLVEVRFGQWQGLTYEEVAQDPRYLEFAADPVAVATPGGETVADVQRRALQALGGLRDGETVLFVTHGDLIRAVLCHFLDTPLSSYRRLRADNCGLSAVGVSSGAPEVKFLNVMADPARARQALHWRGRA